MGNEVSERQAFKDTEGYGYSLEFRKKIIHYSESDDFKSACDEWNLDHIEKHDLSTNCICGKEIYNYCYIRNMLNMNQTIIGTDCLGTMDKAQEKQALKYLVEKLKSVSQDMKPEDIQTIVYSVGKEQGYSKNLRDWFKLIYEVLFGETDGPRMGFFISFFGIKETIKLINDKIK